MKNETVLNITHLEGYAGLRLKDNRELEIKKGINLLVGRNGSGKSALTDLVEFIFSDPPPPKNISEWIEHKQKLLETSFLKPLYENIIERYKKLEQEYPPGSQRESQRQTKLIEFIRPGKVIRKICSFELNHLKGEKVITPQSVDDTDKPVIDHYIQTLNNETFLDKDAPLTVNWTDRPNKQKNYKIISIKAGTDVKEISSFKFGAPVKQKPLSNKPADKQNPPDSSVSSLFKPIFNRHNDMLERERELNEERLRRFDDELMKFEESLSEKLQNYWGQVGKQIKIKPIDENRLNFNYVLTEGENEITFDTLSDGEKNLFNLILNLHTARATKPDLIIIDEPEIYMHDDMIRKLVAEINTLAEGLPETCIMLSTHNTVLIEEVASLEDKSKVNLIVFEDKQIYNSEQDIDFINALHDNGVRFSPLMISKKPNLFIENTGKKGAKHRDFYLKFFHPRNQPNIVHIGNSGQVKEYKKVLETIQNVVKVDKAHNNKGIIDGDVWLTKEPDFMNYLFGESGLEKIVNQLISYTEFYIPHPDSDKPNIYYFNCWEIENLYLLDELLVYWKPSKGEPLEKEKYIEILKGNKEKLRESWCKTFYRSFLKSVYFGDKLEDFETDLKKAMTELSKITSRTPEIEKRLSAFFDKLLEEDLLHWMPGKEVKCELEKNHYTFNSDDIDFEKLEITKKIREIIH